MSMSNYNNQAKGNCNGTEIRRNTEDLQMASRLMDGNNQSVSNLLLSGVQTTATNTIFNYQGASFGGLYSNPGFNSSLAGYENNLQWLPVADNRIQNQHNQMIIDKGNNGTTHSLPPTTSHSCCVNRFGMLDSLGMSSPIPPDQVKSACEVTNFQSKSALTMNIIDPIQSWLNLPIPTQMSGSQQYCKYGDRSIPGHVTQNYNIPASMSSQINLPVLDQTDLKQNDMCIQSPDACFENISTNNSKHSENLSINNLKQNSFTEDKQGTAQDNSTMLKQHSSYQSNSVAKDWKVTYQNYISSPNIFSTVNDTQENFIFPQYSMQSTNSYYSGTPDNYSTFINKNNVCVSQSKGNFDRNETVPTLQNSLYSQSQSKLYSVPQSYPQSNNTLNSQYTTKHLKEGIKLHAVNKSHGSSRPVSTNYSSLSDCCQASKTQVTELAVTVVSSNFPPSGKIQENKSGSGNKTSASLEPENQNDKRCFKSSDMVSSESDESNIIVEESDDIGEIESEVQYLC